MITLRILWISAGRAVLEDIEGNRLDVLIRELASDEKMIAKLDPVDAFRLGYEAAMLEGKAARQARS
jgi:hypothetical protein